MASRGGRGQHRRPHDVRTEQTRLLYDNAGTGVLITSLVAPLLASVLWSVIPHLRVSAWLGFMLLVSAGRFALSRAYRRASTGDADASRWNVAFAVGAGLAAVGWGGAAVVLYPAGRPMIEMFLVFVLGGMMLGGASLLAARPEAFFAFLLPTGLLPTLRLVGEGDEEHLLMGFLAVLFTAATISTTWRFHRTIESSLKLRFENAALIENLQTAKDETEALNRDLELRVLDRTAKLTEADQRKDEFLATLAHELRNPLAPIRFALDALRSGTASNASERAHDVLERQVAQLMRLVDDLLDVSRITANKIHLRREPHDLARLMTTAAESILPLATASDHTLDVALPSRPIHVNGDGARLVQVFANVLNNAVKFTPRSGHISFTAERQADRVVVRIRDTGIGIAPDIVARVFDMFQQAEPILERSHSGLGIGLTLARRLVEMHDGRIDIRSGGLGQGTEVQIYLPVEAAAEATAVEAAPAPSGASRTLRVLIVEDNLDAAEMLDLAVSQLGHTSRLAHDGATAIAAASQFAPDVILLDIGLPVKNGYDVARTLRNLPEFDHVHIAALTGWGQDEDRRKARDAGFDSHFTKPLAPQALEHLLASIAHRAMSPRDPTEGAGFLGPILE